MSYLVTSPSDFTPEEQERLIQYAAGEGEDIETDDMLWMKIYEYFLNTNQMPYGVAKARTGDPANWICDHIHLLTDCF